MIKSIKASLKRSFAISAVILSASLYPSISQSAENTWDPVTGEVMYHLDDGTSIPYSKVKNAHSNTALKEYLKAAAPEISKDGFQAGVVEVTYPDNIDLVKDDDNYVKYFKVGDKIYLSAPAYAKGKQMAGLGILGAESNIEMIYDPQEFKTKMGQHLNEHQRGAVHAQCMIDAENFGYDNDEKAPFCEERGAHDAVATANVMQNYNVEVSDAVAMANESYAIQILNQAFGTKNAANYCLTCQFLASFLSAIGSFSYVTYVYLLAGFKIIVPAVMLTWIGYRTSKLFYQAGDDGRGYIYSVTSKLALFIMVWLVLTQGTTESPWAWKVAGPTTAEFSINLSTSIQDNAIHNFPAMPGANFTQGGKGFQCGSMSHYTSPLIADSARKASLDSFSQKAVSMGCAIERAHSIGIAAALGVLKSISPELSAAFIAELLIKGIVAVLLLSVFGYSAVWLIFLVLDVAVKILITAAFLPLILATSLFQPTRYVAAGALKGVAGAVMTATGIGIVTTVAFYLLMNTVAVYNGTYSEYRATYSNIQHMDSISSTSPEVTEGLCKNGFDVGCSFKIFVKRIIESDPAKMQIPMDAGSPWLYYLLLSAVCIFALGKKLISMLEAFIGASGLSAMADAAMSQTKTAVGGAMSLAGPAAGAAMALTAKGTMAGGGAVGGAGYGAAKGAVIKGWEAAKSFTTGAGEGAANVLGSASNAGGVPNPTGANSLLGTLANGSQAAAGALGGAAVAGGAAAAAAAASVAGAGADGATGGSAPAMPGTGESNLTNANNTDNGPKKEGKTVTDILTGAASDMAKETLNQGTTIADTATQPAPEQPPQQ